MDKVITRENLKDYHNRVVAPMQGASLTNGTGAIPAYIVGDTMTKGWLSLEENGTALTPVDKQEYIILSPGDWLRKHVMWMDDIQVYRLTGAVHTVDILQRSIVSKDNEEIINEFSTTTTFSYQKEYKLVSMIIADGTTSIAINATMLKFPNNNAAIRTKIGGTLKHEKKGSTSGNSTTFKYSAEIPITESDYGKEIAIYLYCGNTTSSDKHSFYGTFTYVGTLSFDDYETDYPIVFYDTSEKVCGVWINRETIYEKTISCGVLPNATGKSLAHGIENIDTVISIDGSAKTVSGTHIKLPYVNYASIENSVSVNVDNLNVTLATGVDMSEFIESYIILRYTKTI